MKTLVIGYGNALRGDDGVGAEVAEQLEALAFAEVDVRIAVQLQIECAREWADYDRVIVVDAALEGPPVSWERVRATDGCGGEGGTHHMEPGALVGLARRLYGRAPVVYRWRIRGDGFELGEGLTAGARAGAGEAAEQIARLLQGAIGDAAEDVPRSNLMTSV